MTAQEKQAGFTLVEMLVVLALIAFAMTISLPYATKSGDARKLEALSSTIIAELRLSRAKAIAQNRVVSLVVDLKERSINSSPPITIPASININLLTVQGQKTPSDQFGFNFYPDGAASGGKIILTLEERKREIDVNWLTGAVIQGSDAVP
jgi:general secretion pathway protein H